MATELNRAIIDAAKSEGKGNLAVVKAVRDAIGTNLDEKHIATLRDAYYLGRMSGQCGLTEAKAAEMIARSPYPKTGAPTDEQRTQAAQRCFDASKTAWMRIRADAGAPKLKAAAAPKPPKDDASDAPSGFALTVEACDTRGLFDRMATLATFLRKTLDANSAQVTGEAGSVLRGAITDLANAIRDAEAALELDEGETELKKAA